jgi:6-phosphogluconate dehydrogenase
MVHNGIEYGDMQLIAESYHFLRHGMGLPIEQVQATFEEWNRGVLDSYLVQITADILKRRDTDGTPLVDKIVDSAGQKGTGKWTARDALDLGVPLTLISEAVFARYLSSLRDERVAAAPELPAGKLAEKAARDGPRLVDDLRDALYASKIVSYAQGFMLMQAAAREFRWQLDFGAIAGLWRAGCIIRSRFLDDIRAAFAAQPALVNLLLAPFFTEAVQRALPGWRRTLAFAVAQGLPVPAMSAALAFYDSYRSARLPANLIQAQRDYFGAHTYERIDAPRGEFFHTDWET